MKQSMRNFLSFTLVTLAATTASAATTTNPTCSTNLSGVWSGTCANLPGPVHATLRQSGCEKVAFLIEFLDPAGGTLLLRAFDVQVGSREVFKREATNEEKITRPNSEW